MENRATKKKRSHLTKQIDLNNWGEIDIWSKLLNCTTDVIFDAANSTDGSFGEISSYICKKMNN